MIYNKHVLFSLSCSETEPLKHLESPTSNKGVYRYGNAPRLGDLCRENPTTELRGLERPALSPGLLGTGEGMEVESVSSVRLHNYACGMEPP